MGPERKSHQAKAASHGGQGKRQSGPGQARREYAAEADKAKKMADRKAALLNDDGQHLATKINKDLVRSTSTFKTKLLALSYGTELDKLLAFVPPQMTQHLAPEISKYRSFQARFHRGSGGNHVLAFMKWYEWACFEANKHTKFTGHEEAKEPAGEPKTALGQLARDRKHIRALLAMCARHNSTSRAPGVHALLNFLKSESQGVSACRTMEELRGTAPTSVAYAVSRLVLGMATENFASVVLNCHTLAEVLSACPIVTNTCLLDALDVELAMAAKMKAAQLRQRAKMGDIDDQSIEDDVDPDEIADPTVGERHQKTMACIFALVALLARRELRDAEAAQVAKLLSHCYVEHKGLRVLTGQLILQLVRRHPAVFEDTAAVKWMVEALFKFEKLDYLRPEGIQMLIALMGMREAQDSLPGTVKSHLPKALSGVVQREPLEPEMLESMATALFRKEQVTSCHPNVHPIWTQLLELIEQRVAAGESLTTHVTNFVNNVIMPFRRGAVDQPRQDLFRALVQRVGQLGLRAVDEDDRKDVIDSVAAVGFGKRMAVGKPTSPQELRAMTIEELGQKVRSLITQYEASLADKTPAAVKVRTWILREVKAIMLVEHREGANAGYGNEVCKALFRFALKRGPRRDPFNENKALFTLCEVLGRSTRRTAGTIRGRELTRCTVQPHEFAKMLLELEEAGHSRFTTATKHDAFKKARAALYAALQPDAERSVLFYENADVQVLMLLLFFVVSIDDPSNEVAAGLASESITDLVAFYQTGTLTDVEVLYDVLMSFVMRPTAPLQVIPVMAALRPIAISLMMRFARLIKTRRPIDMLLQPLVEAYGTNTRELLRQERARKAAKAAEDDSDAEDDEAVADDADSDAPPSGFDESSGDDDDDELDSSDDEEEEESDDESGTEADDATEADEDADAATDADDDDASGASDVDFEGDDDESWASEGENNEEEDEADTKASPEYLKSLETMLGVDAAEAAQHMYPRDQANKEKADVVRAITLASRIATRLRTPLMIQVFQVLLAVLRENVKNSDDVVFAAAKAAVEMLHRSRNRYFGHWVAANSPTMLVLLADLQSYCRKVERSLIEATATKAKDSETAKIQAQVLSRMRRRLAIVKRLSLSTFHLLGFLAAKNNASEATRVMLAEHYIHVFYDRGWDRKNGPQNVQQDAFHFRHGFAWCFLDAIVDKWQRLAQVETPQRATTFMGVCATIRCMLPRIAGLPVDLKQRATAAIRRFLTGTSLKEIYAVKHTMLYEYFGALKMTVEYNRRVGLDVEWVKSVVNEVTDEDEIQITTATARIVAKIEELLGMTERVLNIKACVPRALLQKQHPTKWRRNATRARANAERKRTKVEKELLAVRNNEPTAEEREDKKLRRTQLKRIEHTERARIRQQRWDKLTSEEKAEARAKAKAKKQERIHLNRERKQRLHERRKAAFHKWRAEKLQEAVDEPAE